MSGALNEAQIRYVVVGGLAVIAHGYVRYTMTFRDRLLWLQDADRLAASLETKRPWIDGDGTVHAVREVPRGGAI